MVASARHTFPLQKIGLAEVGTFRSLETINMFGKQDDYKLHQKWKDHRIVFGSVSTDTQASNSDSDQSSEEEEEEVDDNRIAKKAKRKNKTKKKKKKKTALQLLGKLVQKDTSNTVPASSKIAEADQGLKDRRNWRWDKKGHGETTWIDPIPNAISCSYPMTDFVSEGPVCQRLLERGVAPICQFPKKEGGVKNVMFGPMIDHDTQQPVRIGDRFLAKDFYSQYNLKYNDVQSDTWSNDSRCLNAVICRRAEKNHLWLPPKDLLDDNPDARDKRYKDMLGELDRVDSGDPRLGFFVYGSGGNAVISGGHAPNPRAAVGASTAVFEESQRVGRKNAALSDAARDERIVVVAVGGSYLPSRKYWPGISDTFGKDAEQVAYLGIYKIRDCGLKYSDLTKEDMERLVRHHKKRFPEFDSRLLRGCLRNQRMFEFIPVELPSILVSDGFKMQYLMVSASDPRRVTFPLPRETSLSEATDVIGSKCVYYQQAVDDFFQNEDFRFFLNHSSTLDNPESSGENLFWQGGETAEDHVCNGNELAGGRLAALRTRCSNIAKNQSKMVLCAVAPGAWELTWTSTRGL